MIRISLVQPPVWGVQDPPLGLAQLAGCVLHCDQEPFVFDVNLKLWREAPAQDRGLWEGGRMAVWCDRNFVHSFFEEREPTVAACVEDILAPDPHALALSVAAGSLWSALEIARRAKARSPDLTVILGGPYFMDPSRAEALLHEESAVDIVVSGAGDDVFVKMLGLYKACGRWVMLPGMTRRTDGRVERGPKPVPLSFDLDLAPRADFAGFAPDLYARPEQMPVSASRGCPWRCHFCSSREYWGRYSFKSGDKIFGEVMYFSQRNRRWTEVAFYDIMANGNVPSLARFSEMLLQGGDRAGLTWRINAAVRPEMDRATLALFASAGCREIVYGVESGSERLLRDMNKPLSAALTLQVLRDTKEAGIRTTASFLAGHPGETEDDFEATRRFLERARPWLDEVVVQPLVVEERSYLDRHAGRLGISRQFDVVGADRDWSLPGHAVPQSRLDRARQLRQTARDLGLDVRQEDFTWGPSRTSSLALH